MLPFKLRICDEQVNSGVLDVQCIDFPISSDIKHRFIDNSFILYLTVCYLVACITIKNQYIPQFPTLELDKVRISRPVFKV